MPKAPEKSALPMIRAGDPALARRSVDRLEQTAGAEVRRWASGEATLQQIKGYTDEELYLIAQHGYTLFLNGKVKDAQVVFEGLVAVDPRNDYYYRALGVVYHRQGDAERALRQFTHAITVSPKSAAAYVNRAEVHISRRDFDKALADLSAAVQVAGDLAQPLARKALALQKLLRRKRS
ncbi:tetratricopeptide repeat protein [Myxococcota bacterium]|nr:tetratricopeptide repeat protein [Myxococcota bacterium]